jgi:hypothetical protein
MICPVSRPAGRENIDKTAGSRPVQNKVRRDNERSCTVSPRGDMRSLSKRME